MNTSYPNTEALFDQLWNSAHQVAPGPEQVRAENGPQLKRICETLAEGFAVQRAGESVLHSEWEANDARETIAETLLSRVICRDKRMGEREHRTMFNLTQNDALLSGFSGVSRRGASLHRTEDNHAG